MIEYPKIQSIFKRDEKTHKFILGQYSLPEFEYLKDNPWEATEKIDGTNVRVDWEKETQEVKFGGRTDNAQMPVFLLEKLQQLFPLEAFKVLYPDISMTLFGEGYGARIQKGGGNYISNGCDLALFDVLIDGYWLSRLNVEDIASKLNIKVVPFLFECNINDAIRIVSTGMTSSYGNFTAEGMVLKPKVELKNRRGHRIITKLKNRDF